MAFMDTKGGLWRSKCYWKRKSVAKKVFVAKLLAIHKLYLGIFGCLNISELLTWKVTFSGCSHTISHQIQIGIRLAPP